MFPFLCFKKRENNMVFMLFLLNYMAHRREFGWDGEKKRGVMCPGDL